MPPKRRCIVSYGLTPRKPTSGKRALLLSLMAGLSFGCASQVRESNYQVEMPILAAPPHHHNCTVNDMATICTCFVKSDAEAIIRKLKAACLALGGTEDACQTTPSARDGLSPSSP